VQYVETSDFLKTVSIRGLNDSGGGLFQTAGITIYDATFVAYMDNVFNETYWQGASIAYNIRGATVPYYARAFGVRFMIRN
jgi:hypothetical protein